MKQTMRQVLVSSRPPILSKAVSNSEGVHIVVAKLAVSQKLLIRLIYTTMRTIVAPIAPC